MDPSDYMKDPRPVPASQLTMGLPAVNTIITTHSAETGKSTVHSRRTAEWTHQDDKQFGSSVTYTIPFDSDLSDDKDLTESDELIEEKQLGLVREQGTICRYVDFMPGYTSQMHRTMSVDYCVLLEGNLEMILEDDSDVPLRKGDVVIVRGGMHAWKNPSSDAWARLMLVSQSTKPFTVNGEQVNEKFLSKEEDTNRTHRVT